MDNSNSREAAKSDTIQTNAQGGNESGTLDGVNTCGFLQGEEIVPSKILASLMGLLIWRKKCYVIFICILNRYLLRTYVHQVQSLETLQCAR